MKPVFSYEGARRMIFGSGIISRLGEEAKALGASKVMLVIDKTLAATNLKDRLIASLKKGRIRVVLYDEITPEPSPQLADQGAESARKEKVHLVVSAGGGSSMDVGKAIAVLATNGGKATDYIGLGLVKKPGLPTIMVPTTAGTGSETTFTAVFTMRETKTKGGINSPFLYPSLALLDPELTLSLPPRPTAYTGMDALAHAVEAFTSTKANQVSDIFAMKAVELIAHHLRVAVFQGSRLDARESMLLASYLAGMALANAGVTAVHALAYPLGALFDIPHGLANGTLLPHVMRYNAPGNVERFALIAEAMGYSTYGLAPREASDLASEAVSRLAEDIGMPSGLSELGIPESSFEEMAAGAIKLTRPMENNPRPMSLEDIIKLYQEAY
jgi:alcohol dehydrogenase class IV